MNSFQEKILAGKKVITAELTPPRGSGIKKFLCTAAELSQHVDAINITDNQRAVMRMSSVAASAILAGQNINPICQIVCRDRNSLALQSDLIGAAALGIKNILALTGDPVQGGDNPNAKKVFEFESVKLLSMLSLLNQGYGWNKKKLNCKTDFFLGATVNPTSANIDVQLRRMEQKIEAGAKFFQTQSVFDIGLMEKFIKKVESFKVPIIAGIIMMKSSGTASFLHERVLGIRVPEGILHTMNNAKDPEETGVHIAASLTQELFSLCHGVHLMAPRREHRIQNILQIANIR
ncbi:MAG: methylenetetrahydrofolate reductase [Deltaproteobacteria bacterium]|nr:methylenetetrahydrofolate reductase [Deltaproteobacteria bacterium]